MRSSKTKKQNHRMGLGFFAAGVCLVWLPTVAVIDLSPAWLGYLLMCRGLYQLADLDENIEDARRLFMRMAILSAARLVSIPLLFGFLAASERPVMILTIAFVLAIADLVTLIPAWKKLCTGLIYLATRHDGTGPFISKGRSPRNLTEKATTFTIIFFCIKESMTVLPELTVLTSTVGGADSSSAFYFPYLYNYISLMRGFAALVVLIFGVVWLVRMWKQMRRIIADRPFFERLDKKYADEVLTRPDLFAKRRIKATLICTCVALAFSVDFYLDDINVIPDFLIGAFFLAVILLLRRYVRPTLLKQAGAASAVYTAVSAAAWIIGVVNPPLGDLSSPTDDLGLYALVCSAQLFSRLTFVIALWTIIRVWKEVVRHYTGFSVTNHDVDHPDRHVSEVHKELNRRLGLVLVIGAVAAAVSVIYSVTLPWASSTLWEIWVLVDIIAQIGLFVSFIAATNAILEQVEYKYMLS